MPSPSAVAVIDIGSNTIKLLVARATLPGRIETVRYAVEEARISRGISAANPKLDDESRARGLAAIQRLLAIAAEHQPASTTLVATSAVRDAANGADFIAQVREATGHTIRLLSGDEEANYIGRGLAADPALAGARDFYSFDLGGGSLECLEFRDRRIAQGVSYRLGCVRLTERCVPVPAAPFTADDRARIAAVVRAAFESGTFRFTLPAPASAIGTGGTVSTARSILAALEGQVMTEGTAIVTVAQLETLFAKLAPLTLDERLRIPGVPTSRSDVLPTALATMLEVGRLAGVDAFVHSFFNLRYGIAVEALGI